MRYSRRSAVVAVAALLGMATQAAEARSRKPVADAKPAGAVRQAIVQRDASFIITPVEPLDAPDSAPARTLIPVGGAVKIDRKLLDDITNRKAPNDAQL